MDDNIYFCDTYCYDTFKKDRGSKERLNCVCSDPKYNEEITILICQVCKKETNSSKHVGYIKKLPGERTKAAKR